MISIRSMLKVLSVLIVLAGLSIFAMSVLASGQSHPFPTQPSNVSGPIWGKTYDTPDTSGLTTGWYKSFNFKINTTNQYELMKIDTRSYYLTGPIPIGNQLPQPYACLSRDVATCQSATGICSGPGSDVWSYNPTSMSIYSHIVTQHKYTELGPNSAKKFYTSPVGVGTLYIDGSHNDNRQVENNYYFDGFGTGNTGCTDPTP